MFSGKVCLRLKLLVLNKISQKNVAGRTISYTALAKFVSLNKPNEPREITPGCLVVQNGFWQSSDSIREDINYWKLIQLWSFEIFTTSADFRRNAKKNIERTRSIDTSEGSGRSEVLNFPNRFIKLILILHLVPESLKIIPSISKFCTPSTSQNPYQPLAARFLTTPLWTIMDL